ncbi:fasciclin domain-containing protein [Erythrobacter sp. HL-111]|nr:fasciclin domain-containing protein [Erythrobacter sp. HL-111]
MSGDGPFTVFAPTDEAFGKLPEGTSRRSPPTRRIAWNRS